MKRDSKEKTFALRLPVDMWDWCLAKSRERRTPVAAVLRELIRLAMLRDN